MSDKEELKKRMLESWRKSSKIVNAVCSAKFFRELPLEKIYAKASEKVHPDIQSVNYDPERFPGLIMRIKEPKFTTLLFSSGKGVIVGLKDPTVIPQATEKIDEILRALGIDLPRKPELELENLVASGDLGVHFNLNDLMFKLENVEYEPEQFPGLIYAFEEEVDGSKNIKFLIFSSGKIVCTGARKEEHIKIAVERLIEILSSIM